MNRKQECSHAEIVAKAGVNTENMFSVEGIQQH
mgnify:CR=1 FL=1